MKKALLITFIILAGMEYLQYDYTYVHLWDHHLIKPHILNIKELLRIR